MANQLNTPSTSTGGGEARCSDTESNQRVSPLGGRTRGVLIMVIILILGILYYSSRFFG
ncbi:hypothetical protein [Balneola sp. EhC07]|uniref:hypothetical protein n=1 Tax=Balneola sp. EhC07 TaxID=1849360 RepID=UPI0013724AB8|nr:hypothetical protein [Balneola sp. EhC07]